MFKSTTIKECAACKKEIKGNLTKAVAELERIDVNSLLAPHMGSVDKPFIKKRVSDATENIKRTMEVL